MVIENPPPVTELCLFLLCLPQVFGGRDKRFLIVPPTSPSRHQWIAGIGIPLDLENIAVTTGYVLKAQFYLPTQVNQLFPLNTWENIERIKVKRDVADEVFLVDNSTGTKYSQYNVPAVVVEEGPNSNDTCRGFASSEDNNEFDQWENSDQVGIDSEAAQTYWSNLHDPAGDKAQENSRWGAYKLLEGVTSSIGVGGRHCVLRTILESAASPISHKSGIMGEILHILLTPSSSADKVSTDEHRVFGGRETGTVGPGIVRGNISRMPDISFGRFYKLSESI